MKSRLALTAALLALAGCSGLVRNGDGTIDWKSTFAADAPLRQAARAAVMRIGADIVRIECADSGVATIIAADAGASQRVQDALAANAKLAADLCPALAPAPLPNKLP